VNDEAHARPLPAGDVLDTDVIAELRGLAESVGDDFLSEIAQMFLTESSARIADLHDAVHIGDATAAAAHAHSLAGSAANLGARGLAALCATLEDVCRSNDISAAQATVDGLDSELERVEPAVRALLSS
jgi:HPt (histidine-containing phosphotransfer) domain-containing protein